MQSTHAKTAKSNANDQAARSQKSAKLKPFITAIGNGVGYSSNPSLAAYFSLSRSTTWGWVRNAKLPSSFQLSRALSRWSNARVKTWPGRTA